MPSALPIGLKRPAEREARKLNAAKKKSTQTETDCSFLAIWRNRHGKEKSGSMDGVHANQEQ